MKAEFEIFKAFYILLCNFTYNLKVTEAENPPRV